MSHVASLPGAIIDASPLVMLTSLRCLTGIAARARGHDPDTPSRLKKVTETV